MYGYRGGPCYRCLFPVPPPANTVVNCSDGGVLGPVVGVIGSLQAVETIKIIALDYMNKMIDQYPQMRDQINSLEVLSGRMLLYDGAFCTMRNIRLRPRNKQCAICGDEPSIKALINYRQFCSGEFHDHAPDATTSSNVPAVTAAEYSAVLASANVTRPHVLLDVREQVQYDICRLPNSLHIPLKQLEKQLSVLEQHISSLRSSSHSSTIPIYVLCRRGIFSAAATKILLSKALPDTEVYNIAGGLNAWKRDVDPAFAMY